MSDFALQQESEPENSKPHFHGHRDRLRGRFKDGGAQALADYELLELILFSAIPRKDVKPLAKTLLQKFKTISGVVNASPDALTAIPGISDNTALLIKSIQACALKMMQQDILNQPILNSWQRLLDYCHASMAHEREEQFRLLFLNRKNVLIADEIQQRGTVDQAPVYIREVIKRALELGATALILVHNHPSGDPTPSQTDIDITREIINSADGLGIVIHDHVIIAKNGHTSFKQLGLI